MVLEVAVSDLEAGQEEEEVEEEVVLVWAAVVLVSEDVGPKISHGSIFPCASLVLLRLQEWEGLVD